MTTPAHSASTAPSASTPAAAPDISTLLGADSPRSRWQRPSTWLAVVAAAGLLAGAWWLQGNEAQHTSPQSVSEPAKTGNLAVTVAANGTLSPTRSVNVGSELSGTVKRVSADVNDRVTRGQVLLELDTAKLQDQVSRSRAALVAAQASVAEKAATVKEQQANLARLEEVARLSGGQVPSSTDLDAARASTERAQAALVSARAVVDEAKATLSTDETNLGKSSIRSPINGVVLTRSVEPGNAVAASLQAVTLFVLAEDLTSLLLNVAVDEADVGNIRAGQTATFTVSAHPNRKYPATITRVAFGSTKTDGVVTYTTELKVDNRDMSLRPGMTASATVVATERPNVLLVPNTALRFTPAQSAVTGAGAGGSSSGGSMLSKLMPRPPSQTSGKGRPAQADGTRQVWVLENGQARALSVQTGITDGKLTEITGGELTAGMAVITDQRSGTAGSPPATGAKP